MVAHSPLGNKLFRAAYMIRDRVPLSSGKLLAGCRRRVSGGRPAPGSAARTKRAARRVGDQNPALRPFIDDVHRSRYLLALLVSGEWASAASLAALGAKFTFFPFRKLAADLVGNLVAERRHEPMHPPAALRAFGFLLFVEGQFFKSVSACLTFIFVKGHQKFLLSCQFKFSF